MLKIYSWKNKIIIYNYILGDKMEFKIMSGVNEIIRSKVFSESNKNIKYKIWINNRLFKTISY